MVAHILKNKQDVLFLIHLNLGRIYSMQLNIRISDYSLVLAEGTPHKKLSNAFEPGHSSVLCTYITDI